MARIREAEGDLDGAARPARRGRAPLRRRLLPERPAGRRRCGRGCWLAQGRWADALGWARERGPVRRRRAQLPARVRARHPRPGAPGPVHGRAGRALAPARRPAPGAPRCRPPRTAGGRAASSRSWCCRRSRTRPRGDVPAALASLRPRADAGRAGGLRPDLRRRGPADGGAAESRRRSRGRPGSYVRRLLAAVGATGGQRARRSRA